MNSFFSKTHRHILSMVANIGMTFNTNRLIDKVLTNLLLASQGFIQYAQTQNNYLLAFSGFICGSLIVFFFVKKLKLRFQQHFLAMLLLLEFALFIELVVNVTTKENDRPDIWKYLSLGLIMNDLGQQFENSKLRLFTQLSFSVLLLIRVLLSNVAYAYVFTAFLLGKQAQSYLFYRECKREKVAERTLIKKLTREARIGKFLLEKTQNNVVLDPVLFALRRKSIFSSILTIVKKDSNEIKGEGSNYNSWEKFSRENSLNNLLDNKEHIKAFIKNFQIEHVDDENFKNVQSFDRFILEICELLLKNPKYMKKAKSSEEILKGIGSLKEAKGEIRRSISFKIYAFYEENESASPLLILSLKDLTLKNENKKLKQFDEFKDKLLATVVHDMRAPLSMVLTTIETSKRCNNIQDLQESLKMSEINAKLLDCLISDILDYSLFKNNRLSLVGQQYSLQLVLEEAMSLIELQASHKQVYLEVENRIPHDYYLYSDQRRLKQVLINLLTNAIKFTKSGSIKLKAEFSQDLEETIKIDVIDTGAGIKKENMMKLCEPFASFDVQEGLNKHGIGLGLYISKTIVSQIGPLNEFIVKSEEGRGTSFSFYIFEDLRMKEDGNPKTFAGFEKNPTMQMSKHKTKPFLTKTSFGLGFEIQNSHRLNDADIGSIELEDSRNICLHSSQMFNEIKAKNPFSRNENETTHIQPSFSLQNTTCAPTSHYFKPKRPKGDNMEKEVTNPINSLFNSSEMKVYETLTVLIVDDNIFNTLVLETMLKKVCKDKVLIEKASDGECAVQIFEKQNRKSKSQPQHFHIIFMDCFMPIMDGLKATALIKQMSMDEAAYEKVVVAGLSAMKYNQNEKDECFAAGMDYIFQKPISEDTLREFLKNNLCM